MKEEKKSYESLFKLKEMIIKNSKKYISLEMRNQTLELWTETLKEIQKLEEENQKLKEEVRNISINYAQVSKFKERQGQGKKTSPKLIDNKKNILLWKSEGMSNREVARQLDVSEGTIRHFLKSIKSDA